MYIIKGRREILRAAVLAAVGLAIGVTLRINPFSAVFGFGSGRELTVVVDAGHGLPDGGAVGENGTVEQGINLAVAQKLREVLEGKGISVVMTREDEYALAEESEGKTVRDMKREDMNKRREIIRSSGADLFVSVHMNFFESDSVSGLRLFYSKNHPEIIQLTEAIQENMGRVTNARINPVKAADDTLFLMKNTPIPSILIECGFISNPEEEQKLNTDDYRARLAWAIADSIERYYAEK